MLKCFFNTDVHQLGLLSVYAALTTFTYFGAEGQRWWGNFHLTPLGIQ